HGFIPTLVVHMWDPDAKIRAQCRVTFAAVGRVLGRELRQLVRGAGLQAVEASSPQLGFDTEWAPGIAEYLASRHRQRFRGYVDGFLGYFSSHWNVVRGNAVVVVAHLLATSSSQVRQTINVNSVIDCKFA